MKRNFELAQRYANQRELRTYVSNKPELFQIITDNPQKVCFDIIAITLYAKVTEEIDRVIVQ